MYLSRAELDPTRRETMVALISPQKFHGAVENAFAGARRRRLWRLDQLGEKLYLLLLSEERPDLTALCAQFGTGAPPETRPYDPLLERVTAGSCWQFRLTANPTRSKKDSADHMARGTLKPCYLEVEQEEWLWAQAAKHGFAVSEGAFAVTRKRGRPGCDRCLRSGLGCRGRQRAGNCFGFGRRQSFRRGQDCRDNLDP